MVESAGGSWIRRAAFASVAGGGGERGMTVLPVCTHWTGRGAECKFLFVGNPRGGRSAAILASLTSTCRRHEIDPRFTSRSCC